jgi:hypothetical protein
LPILGQDVTREDLDNIINIESFYSLFEKYLEENFDKISKFPKMSLMIDLKNGDWRVHAPVKEFSNVWRKSDTYTKKRVEFLYMDGTSVFLDCSKPRMITARGINIKEYGEKKPILLFWAAKEIDINKIYSKFDIALHIDKTHHGRNNEAIIRQAYLLDESEFTYDEYLLIKGRDPDILSENEYHSYIPEVIKNYWLRKAKMSLRK